MIARTGEDLLTKNFIMVDGNCFKKVVMTFMSQDDVNTLGATPLRLQMKDIKDKNGEPLTKEAISWEGEEGDSSDPQLVYLGKICAVPPTYNTHHGHPLKKPLPEDPAEGPKTCPKFRAVFEGWKFLHENCQGRSVHCEQGMGQIDHMLPVELPQFPSQVVKIRMTTVAMTLASTDSWCIGADGTPRT